MKTPRLLLACAALSGLAAVSALAQGTAFTYQGVLSQGGVAFNGSNDLTFTLYNAVSGGATVGTSNVVNDLAMSNGLFAATLDFGAGAFDGSPRWLQIAARPGASTGGYTNLAPRTPITATPYAIFAGGASAAGLSGTLPATALSGNYGSAVNLNNAANQFSGNGANLTSLNASQLTAGTIPDARLSANVALRAGGNTFDGQQIITGGNVGIRATTPMGSIGYPGGWEGLHIQSPTGHGLNIIQGANSGRLHLRADNNITNIAQDFIIANGANRVDFQWLGGGLANRLLAMTIATNGNIGLGTASPTTTLDVRNATPAITVGSAANTGGALYFGNPGHGVKRAYSGGNDVGLYTTAADVYLSASGTNTSQFVLKNNGNIGIGTNSPETKLHLVGASDTEFSIQSAANNRRWTLQASGGDDGVGLGGTFQIIDRTASASRLRIDVNGNVTIPLELTTTAVNLTSDRNSKEDFKPVNAREVLDKVARLPISEWQYKTQTDARHIGPMAQDFHKAFALGRDDKHITSVDADGVALAAIQGLNEKVEEKDARIQELEKSVAELKELVTKLARQQAGGDK